MNTHGCRLILMLLVLILALAAPACSSADGAGEAEATAASDEPASEEGGADDQDGEEDDGPQAVPVEVAELGRGPIESVLKSTSTLEAERAVEVYAEAARRVRALRVEEGDRVNKGDVLLRLQDDEQRSALAKVENELGKAEREHRRQERLYAENLISEEQFNNATFELEQLRIALADAERELGYTEVKAPISGTVTRRLVNVGDHVNIGQHLFDMVDFDSLVARIYVPEKHLPELRPGQQARVSARATGGREYVGVVDRIAPVVDARTGTVKVTIDVGGKPGLLPGMYVDVDLITATRDDALLVPKRAVVYDNDQMFVFRLGDERRVERVLLEPKLSDKDHVEPLGNLAEGDQIVVAGQAGLKDGALVKLPGDNEKVEAPEAVPAETVERAAL